MHRAHQRPILRRALMCRHGIGQGAAFLARILQFMETPQYLRK